MDESNVIDEKRLMIPALAGLYRQAAPLGYALLRIVIALIFLPGGIDKLFYGGAARIVGTVAKLGFAPPFAWAWIVAILEFFGAILLALGFFTRPVAFAFTVELTVVGFGIMIHRGFFWTVGGLEVALLMELATVGFVFGGGGRYSIDRLIGREF